MRVFRNFKYLAFFLLLFSCAHESAEDVYIKSNLPAVLNLEDSDIMAFKSYMQLDTSGRLTSWNNELLEKAYKEEFEFALAYIISELGGAAEEITIIDADNKERVFRPGFSDINNTKYSLTEIRDWNALFYVTSTNCGRCLIDFKKMNDFALKNKDKGLKFVAVFEKVENIANYKKGHAFKTYGFLNDEWIVLPQKNLLTLLTKKYQDSLGFPFLFFRKEHQDFGEFYRALDETGFEKTMSQMILD